MLIADKIKEVVRNTPEGVCRKKLQDSDHSMVHGISPQ